jgi:hypothetical protein
MLRQEIGSHCATTARDACTQRTLTDVEQHNVLVIMGGAFACQHTHDAWKACEGCYQIFTHLYTPKHRR